MTYICLGGRFVAEGRGDIVGGYGTIEFKDVFSLIVGGKVQGIELLKKANGNVYKGVVKDGRAHGKGNVTYADGDRYEGEWKSDKRQGKGISKYVNGDIYDGDWKDNKRHGKGMYKWPEGSSYNGDWKDGNRHGKGIMKYANGDVYVGEWRSSKRHGHGEYTHANGAVYKGEWMSDMFQGEGKDDSKVTTDWTLEFYSIFAKWLNLLREMDYRPTLMLFLVLGILGWLLEKKGARKKKAVVVLTDEHKICSICFEPFSMDMGTRNENARKHFL